MPAHAGIKIHVACNAPDRKSTGLDGDIKAKYYLSWVASGQHKDPEDPKGDDLPHDYVVVDVLGNKANPAGVGDDAVSIANKLAKALGEKKGAPSHRVGTTTVNKPANPRRKGRWKGPICITHAFVEFDDVETIDSGCCEDKGKVRTTFYGNVVGATRKSKQTGPAVEVIPVRVSLADKGMECPKRLVPRDVVPGPIIPAPGPPAPPPPVSPVPPTTPPPTPPPPDPLPPPGSGPFASDWISPWPQPPGPLPPPGSGPFASDWTGPWPPPPKKAPYKPPPVAEPYRPGPYIMAADGGGGFGHQRGTGERATGVFHLAFGSDPLASDLTNIYVPWSVVRSSPQDQLVHIYTCMQDAGVDCELDGDGLLLFADAATGTPLVSFSVTTNYAGQGFPWIWIADLWQESPDRRAPGYAGVVQLQEQQRRRRAEAGALALTPTTEARTAAGTDAGDAVLPGQRSLTGEPVDD